MLAGSHIVEILREGSFRLKHVIETHALESVEQENRIYALDEFIEFKRDLIEAGNKTKLLFLEYSIPVEALNQFVLDSELVLTFKKNSLVPVPLFLHAKNGKLVPHIINPADEPLETEAMPWLTNEKGEVVLFVMMPYNNMVSEDAGKIDQNIGPVRRFIRLLSTEKKEIIYVLFYAVIIGLIGLILPLGIQTTIELISGGVFFSSIYLLIGLVIFGVVFSGILQIIQISLVEHIQRRIFTKAAFEFAFRIPRLKIESIAKNYAPELVNRFFDIMTIQKGLPKFLIDLSSSAFQIFFGLLLLSLYHPFFVFFSLVLVTVLVAIFYFTGPKGLESSLLESKYKYKVVYWFEELARTLTSFKLAGNTNLPLRKTDYNVSNYLKYRGAHFSVLITQFSFIVLFKGIITGSLLIIGTILVVDREITLGQFVASEIIIILILNAVEKVIMYMDVVYDLLTAVDKIGHITDLPLDKMGGTDLPSRLNGQGYAVRLNNLKFKYPGESDYVLKGINLEVKPGDRICISGTEGSGKTTLTNIIAGLQQNFEGALTVNNHSIRDLDLTHLRNRIANNISPEEIFEGTILENITLGKDDRTVEDALVAIEKAGLQDKINSLPEGLHTPIISGGKGFSGTMIHRLILARCIAKKPELIMLNDFFSGLIKSDKLDLIQRIINKENNWTVIAVSNDPLIMSACDHVVVMKDGSIEAQGSFENLMMNKEVSKYFV